MLWVGFAGSGLAWLVNELDGTISGFTRVVFAATFLFLASQIWLVRGERSRVGVAEEAIYVFIGAVLLSVMLYALYLGPPERIRAVSLTSLYLWFPFIYIFVFLAYGRRGALVRAVLFYALTLAVSLPHVVSSLGSEDPFEGFNSLGQLYVSSAAIIAVLFFFARMKERLAEVQAVAEQMSHLARTDPLTEIPNRRGVETFLEGEMERASRYGLPLALITFDLDDFKALNDTLGHDAGDLTLTRVARLVEPHLRASDGFGRWGGEEFVIVAPGTSAEPARRLAERVRRAIEEHDFGPPGRLSASFGVATYRPGDSATTLAKRADIALYRAKESGKNRVESEGDLPDARTTGARS